MSKKNGVMDLYFQKYNVFRVNRLQCYIDYDRLTDLLDPKLHFPENIECIVQHFRDFAKQW